MTIALVTRTNRGMGLEVVRQLAAQGMTVMLAARDMTKAQDAAEALKGIGLNVIPKVVDVADDAGVPAAAAPECTWARRQCIQRRGVAR